MLKAQLSDLFQSAGVTDDFVLPNTPGAGDMQSVLDDVREKHEEHIRATQPLYVRGNKSARFLRSIGVVLTIEDRGTTFLVTLPERFDMPTRAMDAGQAESYADSSEAREFLRQRDMMAFDFRMGGSFSSVEHLVGLIEQLERLYRANKGTCLRPGVTICIKLEGSHCATTDDGVILLPAGAPHTWEEFLLTIPQPTWNELVRLNREWRAENPTKLNDHKTRERRVADMLHYHSVVMQAAGDQGRAWQDAFLTLMLKEEAAIRKTVMRYAGQLKLDDLKKRGKLHVCKHLWRQGFLRRAGPSDEEIAFRITADGRTHINASLVKPVPLLKFLRDNNVSQAKKLLAFDKAMAGLEGLSRQACVEMAIDPEWRDRCADLAHCIDRFVATAKPIAKVIAAKLQSQRKGLLLIVSDRYQVTPSGKALVPWDADVGQLQMAMIGR